MTVASSWEAWFWSERKLSTSVIALRTLSTRLVAENSRDFIGVGRKTSLQKTARESYIGVSTSTMLIMVLLCDDACEANGVYLD